MIKVRPCSNYSIKLPDGSIVVDGSLNPYPANLLLERIGKRKGKKKKKKGGGGGGGGQEKKKKAAKKL